MTVVDAVHLRLDISIPRAVRACRDDPHAGAPGAGLQTPARGGRYDRSPHTTCQAMSAQKCTPTAARNPDRRS
jgi:hypothetical protein